MHNGLNLSGLSHNGLGNQRRQRGDNTALANLKIAGASAGAGDHGFEIIAKGSFGTGGSSPFVAEQAGDQHNCHHKTVVRHNLYPTKL
jgi:hypothetical protein